MDYYTDFDKKEEDFDTVKDWKNYCAAYWIDKGIANDVSEDDDCIMEPVESYDYDGMY